MVMLLSVGQMWATDYQLVTSTDDLEAGANYVIGSATSGSAVFMATTSNNNNRKQTSAITITDAKISATSDVLVLELKGSTGAWKFLTKNYLGTDGYLSNDGGTGKNNYCLVGSTEREFTISFSSNAAVITATSGNSRNLLRYNSSSSCFACYSSGQNPIYLFKEVASGGGDTPTLTSIAVSGTPTKTSYYAGDNFDPAGLTVTGTYSDASPAPITSGITWSYNPSQTLVKDQTSIGVVATVSSIASAEYNVTGLTVTAASPKITITQNEVADFAATYAQYTWTAGGVSGKLYAYKNAGMQFNPSKTGYYVYNTDPIPGRITKITMTKASGTDRSWTPYVSTTAMTSASGTALDAQTVTTSGASWDVTGSNSYFYLTVSGGATVIGSIVIEYTEDAPPAIDAPSISGDVNFVGSTTVTISHEDADHIYYTTNGVDPTTSSTEYTAPFVVNADGTTTVKAIAVKGSDVSEVASKGFTKVTALESLAALLEATTSSETAFNVVIDNWVVTGVNGTRAWISDAANEKGILLYKSGHNFTAGNKLNGVVIGTKTKLYQGYPEMTTLVSTDVTVTTAEAITPRATTIAALTSGYPNEQGTVVKLENLTYTASSTSFSDGENTLALNTQLYNPSMVDGAIYTVIGVVRYDNNAAISIMPRSVDDIEQTGEASLPEVTGLAALKAETTGASYLVNLTNAIVTLVDGNNAFIEDATAGALIYFSGHGYAAGDKLNGQYEVTTATYQGKFEITAMTAQEGATKTADAEIPVTTLTIAQLAANFAANESKRIKIVGVNVTDAIANNDRNGQISDGENTFALYAGKNGIAAAENANIDVIGYPTFFNEAHQFNVWAQADITVNEKEDPELAWDPASETIEQGDDWSAPAFANPHSLSVTFSSDDESVATVSNTGVVALAGGLGTAVITAHTDGDATYAAGNATYTITVNEAGTYSMSFDLTRASYDDAADAEVVWNSSVVTFTADKNEGTKVTNYLAGNYTGATLITETRFYTKNSLSFVPQTGVTITKVEWMSTAKGYATKLAAETWTNASAVVDATDDKLVIITPTATGEFSVTLTDAARATGITVYYTAESEKAKLTASIAIENINMVVGDDDILLSAIEATSNPNKKAISYAVTSGTAVTIEGTGAEAALHAAAEGSATITATIPDDLGNYTGATKNFTVTVAAAPATLESIAISGEASVLDYTDGETFNPTGLTVMGTYSDQTQAEITEGIDWTFNPDPLTEGTTSVSVTATVGEISSVAVVVNGLTVSAAPAPTSGNVVILAEYNSKFYAMSNSLGNGALAGVEVEKDGSKIVVSSAEDKAAIQWTATVDGNNTTLKDAENNYIKGSSGASLSLEADPYNWNWDGEKSCYISSAYTNRGLFFNSANNVFKGYALSNITSDGYAATEVIEIDPEDIVISSKVDPELAYTPASDEITVGDAWSAPVLGYVEGFDGLAAITYESSNEAIATVSDAGVIALAGGTGTATITATFGGNASYLAGSATYTVKVNEPAEDCDGTDDFSTATNTSASSYNVERTTTNGWSSVNSALTTINSEARWLTMLGKTSQVGVITSPTLNDGIASLKIRYANTFNETNGVSFRVDIKQGEDIVKTYTITKENSEVEKGTVYTEIIENINVAGDFQMIFTNLCPSNADSNKDRVSIGRLCWSSYDGPTDFGSYQRTGLTSGNYGTICLPKAGTISGATLFDIEKFENGMIYCLEVNDGNMEAGKPYIFQATSDQLNVVYSAAATVVAGEANGLHGFYNLSNMATDDADKLDLDEDAGNYILYNNQYWLVKDRAAYINNFRAYIKLAEIQPLQNSNSAPRRRVAMTVHGEQVATGIDAINAAEAPIKVMINGQLFIIRGEKMYNANGQLVK